MMSEQNETASRSAVINVFRNTIGTAAALAGALLFTSGAQEAFRRLLPTVSDRLLLGVDVGTYIGFLAYAAAFFMVGLILHGWLRSRFPLIWFLLPVVVHWLWIHAGIWFMLRCSAAYMAACIMSYSLVVVPLIAGVSGYCLRSRLTGSLRRTVV